MKRLIDHHLNNWKTDPYRKPLLLRGARQVGKTHAVREFSKSFSEFIEINLEFNIPSHEIFEKDLDPHRIVRELSVLTKKTIKPGMTLIFFDEIQIIPNALTALRYFYELMPDLHVIAAGSLLDFAIESVGIPVGRVESLYMYPFSFLEFLAAIDEQFIIEEILTHDPEKKISNVVHKKTLSLLGEYLALGGMPQVVKCWRDTNDALACSKIQQGLLKTYRQDFGKYASKFQIKYVELLFDQVPIQIGDKFKYSLVEGEFRKRELAPALDLLATAGIVTKVFYSAAQGAPIGAFMDPRDYKVIFLDVGLSQAVIDLDLAQWFLSPLREFANKGKLVEAFVGQELLVYDDPSQKKNLYYWHSKNPTSQAEIDYLFQEKNHIIPVEVKSGDGRTLKSIRVFRENHASPYGVRFSAQNYSIYDGIHSHPLYAIAQAVSQHKKEVRKAMETLISRD